MLILEIITPKRNFLEIHCDSVTLPGQNGEFQILKNHVFMISKLNIGVLVFQSNHKNSILKNNLFNSENIFKLMIYDGFVEVRDNIVKILCDDIAFPKEINSTLINEELRKLNDNVSNKLNKNFNSIDREIKKNKIKLSII